MYDALLSAILDAIRGLDLDYKRIEDVELTGPEVGLFGPNPYPNTNPEVAIFGPKTLKSYLGPQPKTLKA